MASRPGSPPAPTPADIKKAVPPDLQPGPDSVETDSKSRRRASGEAKAAKKDAPIGFFPGVFGTGPDARMYVSASVTLIGMVVLIVIYAFGSNTHHTDRAFDLLTHLITLAAGVAFGTAIRK